MTAPPGDTQELQTIAHLLTKVEAGDRSALDSLMPLVYQELRAVAQRQRRRWIGDETLCSTALVHELYLKLVEQSGATYVSRSHFLAVASRAMRRILIDYARYKRRGKRGGRAERVPLEKVQELLGGIECTSSIDEEAILALSESLGRLEIESARHCRIVECRFFGGMTIEETAEALRVSPVTVKRGWALAQAWLRRDLLASGSSGPAH